MIDKIMIAVAVMALGLTVATTWMVFTYGERLVLEEIIVKPRLVDSDERQIYRLVNKMIDHVMTAVDNNDYATACTIQKKIVELITLSNKQILLKEAQTLEKSLCKRQREQMI
jgi:hypothetical protein